MKKCAFQPTRQSNRRLNVVPAHVPLWTEFCAPVIVMALTIQAARERGYDRHPHAEERFRGADRHLFG